MLQLPGALIQAQAASVPWATQVYAVVAIGGPRVWRRE
jgi:hypothetical protein